MLQSIRDKLVGWVAWAIVLIIGVPFAIMGVTDFGSTARTLAVAEVDDLIVDQQDYQQRLQVRRRDMQQQLGSDYRPDKFERVLQQQVLNEMIEEKLLENLVQENNLRVGDEELSAAIKSDLNFFQDGKFNFEFYRNRISKLGFTPNAYEDFLKQDRMLTAIPRMVRSSSFITDQEAQRYFRLSKQQRKIDYLTVLPSRFSKDIDIAVSELQTYYEQHASQYVRPEQVKLEYIRLSARQLASRVEVTEDAIRQYYAANADRYVVDEQREASHILINVAQEKTLADSPEVSKKIKEIQNKLSAGEKFEDLARKYSDDPGSAQSGGQLGQVLRGVMVPAFEEALFSMQAVGEISAPIQTSFGVHLIRLDSITPRQAKSYEMVKDQLRESYASEQAINLYYDISEQLAVLTYENPDSLVPVSEAIDVALQTTDWIDQKGSDSGVAANLDVLREAFGGRLKNSHINSDPIEIGINDAVVFRVMDSRPAAQLSFEEAKGTLMVAALKEKQARRLAVYADQIADRIRQGESIQSVAENEKLELHASVLLQRHSNKAPAALVRYVFKMPVPTNNSPVIKATSLEGGIQAIVVFNQVADPEASSYAPAVKKELNQRIAAKDVANLLAKIRQEAKVTIYKDKL